MLPVAPVTSLLIWSTAIPSGTMLTPAMRINQVRKPKRLEDLLEMSLISQYDLSSSSVRELGVSDLLTFFPRM